MQVLLNNNSQIFYHHKQKPIVKNLSNESYSTLSIFKIELNWFGRIGIASIKKMQVIYQNKHNNVLKIHIYAQKKTKKNLL